MTRFIAIIALLLCGGCSRDPIHGVISSLDIVPAHTAQYPLTTYLFIPNGKSSTAIPMTTWYTVNVPTKYVVSVVGENSVVHKASVSKEDFDKLAVGSWWSEVDAEQAK